MSGQPINLEGKVLVVTGGSKGIGKAIRKQASAAGAEHIFFTYHSGREGALAVATERVHPIWFQLGNEGSTQVFLEEITKAGVTAVDYFIANAGTTLSGDLTKHDFAAIKGVIDTNVTGNLFLLRELIIREMMAKGGQVSLIGSIAADGNHDQVAYSTAKAGFRGLVESLSCYDIKVQEQQIGLKLIEPAFVRTSMAERILKIIEKKMTRKTDGEALLNEFRDKGYVMEPETAADKILRLTIDPTIIGIGHTIPEGADLHEIRAQYL